MTVRCARSLLVLLDEINAKNPARDRASDGGLGDPAHAARVSSHNPDSRDVYRARDFDRDGINAAALAERVRQLGLSKSPILGVGAHVIWNRRIASFARGWTWREYTGTNPHTGHVHVAVTDDPRFYDLRTPWGWHTKPSTAPAWYLEQGPMQFGDVGHGVQVLRNRLHLTTRGPNGNVFDADCRHAIRVLQHSLRWSLNNRCSEREARYLERRATGR